MNWKTAGLGTVAALIVNGNHSAAGAWPVENLAVVSRGIYRGARPSGPEAMRFLKQLKVKTILNLQGGDLRNPLYAWAIPYFEDGESLAEIRKERDLAQSFGIHVIVSPLNSLEAVNEFDADQIRSILSILSNPDFYPVYIHCAHGVDRTGAVVALYRMVEQGLSFEAAMDEMRALGHNLLHRIFTSSLDDFLAEEARGLPPRWRSTPRRD